MNKIPIILHCTENYLQNSLNLVKSLNLFHDNLQYYLYTLNFTHKSNIPNLITVSVNSDDIKNDMNFVGNKNDVSNKNMFKSVLFKSKVVIHTIEKLKLDFAIYIDSDILPTGEITELFGYINQVDDYPLIQQGLFEYQINYGRGNPFHKGGFDETNILEYPLMHKHHIPVINRTHYSVTSVMVYNKNCLQFFREYDWVNEMALNMNIEDIKFYYPFSDETTMNVLLWKYKFNKRLPFMQMNIDEINNVKEYYESNYETEKEISSYVRVPNIEKRKNILFFHGAKGELSNVTYEIQKNMFTHRSDLNENKFYIMSNINFNRDILIKFYGDNELIYDTYMNFKTGVEYWFSTNKRFDNFKIINLEFFDKNRLIYKI